MFWSIKFGLQKKCGEHNFKKLAYDKSPEWENNNEHHYTWGERNVLWETVAAGTIAESLFSLSSPVPGEGNEGGEVPDLWYAQGRNRIMDYAVVYFFSHLFCL